MNLTNVNKYVYKVGGIYIPNILKQKFLVFDVEATGLDVKTDYVTQFGCVPVVQGKSVLKKKFCSYVHSPKPIPKEIIKLTEITNQKILNAPSFKDIITPLLEEYKDYIWIAQCGFEFDFPIMNILFKRYKIPLSFPKKMDTKVLFIHLNPSIKETVSTNFLKEYYRINSSDLKRHDALGDSLLVARILEKILVDYKKQKLQNVVIRKPLIVKKFIPKPLK